MTYIENSDIVGKIISRVSGDQKAGDPDHIYQDQLYNIKRPTQVVRIDKEIEKNRQDKVFNLETEKEQIYAQYMVDCGIYETVYVIIEGQMFSQAQQV